MDGVITIAKKLAVPDDDILRQLEKLIGQLLVIKIGGNVFLKKDHGTADDESLLLQSFIDDIILLKKIGIKPVVVHGGGPSIDAALTDANIPITFVDGLRITDDRAIEVVKTAMATINQYFCAMMKKNNITPLPLPAGLIIAKKSNHQQDLGWVGQPIAINPTFLSSLISGETIPVIAPIGHDNAGHDYNINADHVAGFVAATIRAERLLLLTNVAGILDDDKKTMATITIAKAEAMIKNNIIHGGMIPKVMIAINTVRGGGHGVAILDGRKKNIILRQIVGGQEGTLLTA